MAVVAFDHVNIRTHRLDAMRRFYVEVLDLTDGPRPPFAFPGAWLYLGDAAVVHLVGIPDEPPASHPKLEHAAFRASGLAGFLDRLRTRGVPYEIADVPGFGIRQVNFRDPDGNHLHVDFAVADEADPDAGNGS